MSTLTGTTVAFLPDGRVLFTPSGLVAFGSSCCCPPPTGLTSGLIYVETGYGIRWNKPYSAIAKFDGSENVIAGKTAINGAEVLRITPGGSETSLAVFGGNSIVDMDVDSAGNAYVALDAAKKVTTSGSVAWSNAVITPLFIHFSASRNKVIVTSNAVAIINPTSGTTEQTFTPPNTNLALQAVTDASGDTYIAVDETTLGAAVQKFVGTSETATWTATGMTYPIHYDAVASKLFSASSYDSNVYEIDASTGTSAAVSFVNTWQTPEHIDTDSSSRLYVTACAFTGTNYAVLRYTSGTADWGYDPSDFFDFSPSQFAAAASGTATAMTINFDYANQSAPLL